VRCPSPGNSLQKNLVIDPRVDDAVAVSRELSGGDGPDVVFDCAGVQASIKTACEAVRAKGTVVNVAIWEKEIPFQPNILGFKEAIFTSVLGYQRKDFQAVIDHIADGECFVVVVIGDSY
jgi:threonine dehydrogenase-like Zn-dependent dehydrogenase